MMAPTTTLVSAYYDWIKTGDSKERTLEWRQQNFRSLLETGAPMVFFTNCEAMAVFAEAWVHCHVVRHEFIPLPCREVTEEVIRSEYGLPKTDNPKKDTKEYLWCMHAKTVCVSEAIKINPWSTEQFAWIDMSIYYLFRRPGPSSLWIRWLTKEARLRPDDRKVYIPGCWSRDKKKTKEGMISWRFCGSFFWGRKEACLGFAETASYSFKYWVETICNGTFLWEVCFWAWLETQHSSSSPFAFRWYEGDHNDTMLENLPMDAVAMNLSSLSGCVDLSLKPCDSLPGFRASSVSYASIRGEEWLLVRYVNYTIDFITGAFCVNKESGYNKIASKSFFVPVDLDCTRGHWLQEEPCDVLYEDGVSCGLEDIRMFPTEEGEVILMGCNVDRTENGMPQCFVAKLDRECHRINNVKMLVSPHMQKNWIPFPCRKGARNMSFLYGWSRFQVVWGEYSEVDGSWEITERTSNIHPLLHEAKGSSTFVPWTQQGKVVGVVHTTQYKEGTALRQYWHYLVVMDRETRGVVKVAGPYSFAGGGIEYCMGYRFDREKETHDFWVSRMDANPMYLSIEDEEIEWKTIM